MEDDQWPIHYLYLDQLAYVVEGHPRGGHRPRHRAGHDELPPAGLEVRQGVVGRVDGAPEVDVLRTRTRIVTNRQKIMFRTSSPQIIVACSMRRDRIDRSQLVRCCDANFNSACIL